MKNKGDVILEKNLLQRRFIGDEFTEFFGNIKYNRKQHNETQHEEKRAEEFFNDVSVYSFEHSKAFDQVW